MQSGYRCMQIRAWTGIVVVPNVVVITTSHSKELSS